MAANSKIKQVKIGTTTYDVDLPANATPSITSLTTSGNVQVGGNLTDGTNSTTVANLISKTNSIPTPTTGDSGKVISVNASGGYELSTPSSGGMTNPMTTAGDIIVGGSSGTPSRLGIGTSNQVLKVNNAGTGLEWGAGGSGGATITFVDWTPSLITFTYSTSTSLQAEQGMTWEEWVSSEYNTIGATVTGSNISVNGYLLYLDLANVYKTDTIIANANYIATQGSGGSGN